MKLHIPRLIFMALGSKIFPGQIEKHWVFITPNKYASMSPFTINTSNLQLQ